MVLELDLIMVVIRTRRTLEMGIGDLLSLDERHPLSKPKNKIKSYYENSE